MATEDQRQKTGAKILEMLQRLTNSLETMDDRGLNHFEMLGERFDNIEKSIGELAEKLRAVDSNTDDLRHEVRDMNSTVSALSDTVDRLQSILDDNMPDLQTIVQDMERRERAYSRQTPAF